MSTSSEYRNWITFVCIIIWSVQCMCILWKNIHDVQSLWRNEWMPNWYSSQNPYSSPSLSFSPSPSSLYTHFFLSSLDVFHINKTKAKLKTNILIFSISWKLDYVHFRVSPKQDYFLYPSAKIFLKQPHLSTSKLFLLLIKIFFLLFLFGVFFMDLHVAFSIKTG